MVSLAGVELHMSTSYHPQCDGQTKRLNQTMETFLRCSMHSCPTKWLQWLPLAEYGITTVNTQPLVGHLRPCMDIAQSTLVSQHLIL